MYCEHHDDEVLGLVYETLSMTNAAASSISLHNGALSFVAQRLVNDSDVLSAAFEKKTGDSPPDPELKVLADKMVEAGGVTGAIITLPCLSRFADQPQAFHNCH